MRLPRLWLSLSSATTIALAVIGLSPSVLDAQAHNPAERLNLPTQHQLVFEPNMGQTASDFAYLARTVHYRAFLKSNGATFRIYSVGSTDHTKPGPVTPGSSSAVPVITMIFAGASSRALPVAGSELSGKSNYFIGSDTKRWQVGVPQFAEVTYKAIYPGIDVHYHGTQQALEYDFVVAPGADPGMIHISFNQDANPQVTPDGEVVIGCNDQHIAFKKPVTYQIKDGTRYDVASKFVTRPDRQVGIELASYDPTRELIIDPSVVYSSYLGGTDDEGIFGIAFDHHGNIYISGETSSVDFPTKDPVQSGVGGNYDAFVSKFDRTGTRLIYSTYLGGSAYDHAVGIAVDDEGQAYVAGITQSADFPTAHALQAGLKGSSNAFVAKLDSRGSELLFSTYLGGSGNDQAESLAIDKEGDVFVVGGTTSLDFPVTAHAFQTVCGGSVLSHLCKNNGFAAKIDRSGSNLLYSTYLGGNAYDLATAIAIDEEGAAYIVGQATSRDFPIKNAFQSSLTGYANAFLAKLVPAGNNLTFSTYLGGSAFESAEGVAIDVYHNVYLTGFTGSANFPTFHAFQDTQGGQLDAFVAKFNPEGSKLLYSTFLGGSGTDFPLRIVVDAAGYASVSGFTDSTNFPVSNAIHPVYLGGNSDVFVSRFSPDGTALAFSTYLGGSGDDYGYALAAALNGALWMGGSMSSTDLPVVDAYQAKYAGGPYDAFLMKVALDPKDAMEVLFRAVQNLFLINQIGEKEASQLETILEAAIQAAAAGNVHELKESLRRFRERIDEYEENHSLPRWIASDLRVAADDFLLHKK